MVDVIDLLKLLRDLLPEEVYRNIVRQILDLMESEDRVAFAQLRRVLMDWVRKYYPELEKLMKMILDRVRPAAADEATTYLTFGGTLEAGAVLLSGPAAILGGLLLPATKIWGTPHIDLTGLWRDPCDEDFSDIADAYAKHMKNRGSFPTGFTSGSVATMNLLSDTGYILTLCAQFLEDCPNSPRKQSVTFIQRMMSRYRSEYWNY